MNGSSALSSAQTDLLGMDGTRRSTTLGLSNPQNFDAMSTTSSRTGMLDPFRMDSLTDDRNSGMPTDNTVSYPGFSLQQFYNDRDEPWTPVKSNGVNKYRVMRNPAMSHSMAALAPGYDRYRDATALSDCDTIGRGTYSDSGYGSFPHKSMGAPSDYSDMDRVGETQSIIGGFSEFRLQAGSPDTSSIKGLDSRRDFRQPSAPQAGGLSHLCQFCKKSVKTKSEMKKHLARHTKPHVCDEPDCTRSAEGFSTQNDLERHRQSVHKAGGIKYRCPLGDCAGKVKDWPRADNFRQHLKKVHKVNVENNADELKMYISTK
jgi:hypothetical protein